MRNPRAITPLLLALLASLTVAASAVALVDLAAVASSDVAVESGAQLSASGRDRLESAAASLDGRGTPVKFVVLRAKPADGQAYADSLRRKLAYQGDILVLSPGNLRISSALRTADVQGAFDAERPTLRADPVAGTIAVANRLSDVRLGAGASGAPDAQGASDDGGGSGSGGGAALIGLLVLGGGVVAAATVISRRRRRALATGSSALQRESLEPLVDALAAQIGDLDDDMQIAGEWTTAARQHYDVAVLSYGEARDILGAPAQTPASLQAAGAALEKGLRAARRTRAVLEGRPPEAADQEPLLEGMCSFDPKHGKATTSVTITTPGGQQAELPACARCAADMAAGEQPRFREVEHQGRLVPYWRTGGMGMGGAGRVGGRGGGLGPVLGGALAGMILGGMFGDDDANASQGGWGSGRDDSGGSFGGGGGGGDFGGGGGGGDFGGGGGGDF